MAEQGFVAAGRHLGAPYRLTKYAFGRTKLPSISCLANSPPAASIPQRQEARTAVGDDVYEALVQLGRLQPVSPDVVWRADD